MYEYAHSTVQATQTPSSDTKDASHKVMTPSQFVSTQIPLANLLTLKCLIRFLKKVYSEENVKLNKMTVTELAQVFTPTLFRQKTEDSFVLAQNFPHEIQFIKTIFLELSDLSKDEEDKIAYAEKWVWDNYCYHH